jgi:hypothetical protein
VNRSLALPAVAAAAAVTLAACSSGGTPAGTTGSPAAAVSPSPAAGGGAPPGVSGTIAAVAAGSLEVQNPSFGQVTVNFSSATRIEQVVTGTISLVAVGDCVAGVGSPLASGTVAARTVSVSQPVNGSCTAAGAFAGGFRGPGGFRGGRRSPRPSNLPTPPGGFASLTTVVGRVTAVSGAGLTVLGVERTRGVAGTPSPATRDVSVTVESATTVTEIEPATARAFAVGLCATAVGPTDSTGAVTARSIVVRKPGAQGCTTRRPGFGFGGGGGTGNA